MRHLTLLPLAALAALLPAGGIATASKPNTAPLGAYFLPGRKTVLVVYSPTALAEYTAGDGRLVRVYDIGSRRSLWDTSPDERSLVMLGYDGHITSWDLHTGKKRWRTQGPKKPALDGTREMYFSRDGSRLVLAAGAVVLLDARTGAVAKLISAEGMLATSVVLSPDGKAGVALGSGGEL